MTKKHYAAIAEILRTAQCGDLDSDRLVIVHEFADYFESENPRFNRAVFLKAADADYTGRPYVGVVNLTTPR